MERKSRDRGLRVWDRLTAKAAQDGGVSQVERRLGANCQSLQRVREVTRMKVGMSFGMAQTTEGKWVHVAVGSREAGDATS